MVRVPRRLATLLVLLPLFASGATAAEELSNESCLACHAIEGFADSSGHTLFVGAETFDASVHGAFPCTSCHGDVTVIPHEETPKHAGPVTCSACHGDVVASYLKSIHGQATAIGTSDAATCTSCHGGAHAIKKATDPASPVYPLTLPRTCGVCHGDPELAMRHGIPVINAYQLYMDSIHGRALTRSGLLVAANCSSCHGSHDIRRGSDPESKVHRANIPSTCGTCHAGVADAYSEGVHGQAFAKGDRHAPICIDCHTAHQIARVDTNPWKLQIVSECGSCHRESLRTYRDTFHGQVTALGFTPVARCSDCHGSHRVFAASDSRSSVAPEHLIATCQKCHPTANENFVQFSPHADPESREKNPLLYFVTLSMNVLIVGVFAFFGLHTALWLVRSLLEQQPGAPKRNRG
jgi:DnaJ-class molecular chaperone